MILRLDQILGGLALDSSPTPLSKAQGYVAQEVGDGLSCAFEPGFLKDFSWLSFDILVEGNTLVVFLLNLQEGPAGPKFGLLYSALNQVSARARVDLSAVDQNRWRFEREGAWLKPMCWGDRVDLAKVDRMTLTVLRKAEGPLRWFQSPVEASKEAPRLLQELILPKGPILDELGQSRLHDWPGKSKSEKEVTTRLRDQLGKAPSQESPRDFGRWGGWSKRKFEATGFFRKEHDGKRWWLVDPEGHPFWSAGMDCVRVDTSAAHAGLEKALAWMPPAQGPTKACYQDRSGGVPTLNFLTSNLIRAFGSSWYDKWSRVALAELKRLGFNTVANWSDWRIAKLAGFPYVRPLDFNFERRTPFIYRDFPDVYDPAWHEDVREFAQQLVETSADPSFIGYFLMNEPTWGFASLCPAAGMLFNSPSCASRGALADHLKARYGSDRALSQAWGMTTSLASIASSPWTRALTPAAIKDLEDFSSIMVEKLFRTLSEACRGSDPNHLNLGARYYTLPPSWCLAGMKCFDVFSINCYEDRVPPDRVSGIVSLLNQPVLVGEWHFGSLDAGLPGSGIGRVRDQRARGQAFRLYTEQAASLPGCVGVHWFTLYDESALGRYDGENWNIGFLDVCNRPYEELCSAARESHERLYAVASGEKPPFAEAPEYLPKLFL